MLIANAQFLLRAQHGVIVDTAQGPALEPGLDAAVLVAVIERGPFQGVGREEALGRQVAAAGIGQQVGRAGDGYFRLGRAVVDRGQHQAVGVGVLLYAQDLAEHDALAIPLQRRAGQAEQLDALHLQPGVGQ